MSPALRRWLPFLAWPRPTRATLAADLRAGLAVGLVLIPQALAYATLAGMPAQTAFLSAKSSDVRPFFCIVF
ncbi:MAG TPA: SulP family inorganic anion transporter, partial [Plasticicumulans sp.]|nr:SulP family inorganic anion transporter [Plasticicumulans sp.]